MGLLSWAAMGSQVGNDMEYQPDLQWPNSNWTYQKMRNDAQLDGLTRSTILPLTRWQYGINPNNAHPVYVRELSRDLGLPIMERNGETWREVERPGIPRSRNRFNFHEHLTEALLATMYGHQYFEQVADLVTPPPDWPVDTPLRNRLWKLGVRPPWTIQLIETEKDGGLKAIKQIQHDYNSPGIEVNQLLAYVFGKEGANWVGRSLLRSSYRPWLVKDRVMKIGTINIERNGAGIPIVTAPPGATDTHIRILHELATKVRGGDSSGGAIPHGGTLQLQGVMGSQPDAVGFMRFLDQQMARAFLQMVGELGTTEHGSRALGGVFADLAQQLLQAIADWFCATFYEYMILDWMDWNVAPDPDINVDEFAPMIVYNQLTNATDDLNDAIDDGEIDVDDETRDRVAGSRTPRRRRASVGHGGRTAQAAGRRGHGSGQAVRAEASMLPARTLRRQPYDHELAASTDFAALDSAYAGALDLLMLNFMASVPDAIEELHDAIVAANGDLDAIAEISATPRFGEPIGAALSQVSVLAVSEAVNEASRQGRTIERPDLEDLTASLVSRAAILDTMITRDVTESAVRRAVRMTGGSLGPAEVAGQVRDELRQMTWAGVRDQLGGAIQGSQNAGRGLVFRRDGEPGRIYSTEILDNNTCSRCVANDGNEYGSVDEAERDYPFGGYVECEGRERCRGTIVKVYEETPA